MDQSTRTKETPGDRACIAASELAAFAARAFVAAGLPDTDAQTVADLMVEADLRGSDTHGVIRLPLYVRRLRAGGIIARRNSTSSAIAHRWRCSMATMAWVIW